MTFFFFDHNGIALFRRSDAVDFKHYCEEYAIEGSFPSRADKPISAGMIVAWQDEDDAWEAHELTTVELDAYDDEVRISGCHIAITELRCAVVDKVRYEGKTLPEALDGLLSGTGWVRGIIPAGADTNEDRRERYRTKRKAKLRSKASSGGKVVGTYKKGAYVTLINKTSSSWYKVEAADNRIGWMAVGDLTRSGSVEVESDYQVTATEDFSDVWTLLEDACEACGTLPRPRVEIERSGIVGRYIDVQSKTPEYRGVRLTCNTNIREAGVKYDTSQLYTALKGVGKDDLTFANVTWSAANGDPIDKPKGQNYIALPAALDAYGHNGRHRMGVARFGDIDDANALLRATWAQLQLACAPQVHIDCTIADLYALGYGGQSMRLFDLVHIILQPIGLRVAARIEGLTKDLLRPEQTQPFIGTLSSLDIITDLVGVGKGLNRINGWQIRNVNGAVISPGTVGSQQIAAESITAEKIAALAITAGAIAANAVTADTLAAGSITTEKLDAGAITADKLDAETVDAHTLNAVQAKINALTAADIQTDNLAAALARFVVLAAGTASFDRATVTHLVAGAMNLSYGVGEDVFISNLRVAYAQVVSATIGNLCIKASDGGYYNIDVDANGCVQATPVTVTEGEITAGQTSAGRAILETDITAINLSTSNLLATYALVNRIDAARIDVDELFARSAFITQLTTSRILGGKSLTSIAGAAENAARMFRQEDAPTPKDGAKLGDLWVVPSTGANYQAAAAAVEISFALDENGVLGYELTGDYAGDGLLLDGDVLYADEFMLGVDEQNKPLAAFYWTSIDELYKSDAPPDSARIGQLWLDTSVSPVLLRRCVALYESGNDTGIDECWQVVNDTETLQYAQGAMESDLSRHEERLRELNMMVVQDEEGVHVHRQIENPSCETLITDSSFNVKTNGRIASTFGASHMAMDGQTAMRTTTKFLIIGG